MLQNIKDIKIFLIKRFSFTVKWVNNLVKKRIPSEKES